MATTKTKKKQAQHKCQSCNISTNKTLNKHTFCTFCINNYRNCWLKVIEENGESFEKSFSRPRQGDQSKENEEVSCQILIKYFERVSKSYCQRKLCYIGRGPGHQFNFCESKNVPTPLLCKWCIFLKMIPVIRKVSRIRLNNKNLFLKDFYEHHEVVIDRIVSYFKFDTKTLNEKSIIQGGPELIS